MARYTASMAKNFVGRCLRNVIDPVPTTKQRREIWDYFDSQCAYCGLKMLPAERKGQLDHLVPVSDGGSNHFSNFVLSCPGCNGDEKREMDWKQFLRFKAADRYEERQAKISAWHERGTSEQRVLSKRDLEILERVTEEARASVDRAVEELRSLKRGPL